MTSVPNPRPLLSGNKMLSFLLVFLIFISCDATQRAKKTTYPNRPIPEKGQHPKPKKDDTATTPSPKQDTIVKPPVQTLPDGTLPNNRAVKVALILPFLTQQFNESATNINPKSDIAIQFYAGLKLAMEEASYDQVPMDISVIDSKASYSETLNLQSNPDVINADIIVGPYRKKNAGLMAEYAVKQGKIMFSPFSEIQPTALAGKGRVIQTFAGLETYMKAIVKHLIQTGDIANTIIIKRKNGQDNRAVNLLQKAFQQTGGIKSIPTIQELEVDQSDLGFDKLDLKEILAVKPNTVFIIPVWKSPKYVTSIVRKIFVSRDPEESPTIVGMPQWVGFKNMDYQKLNDLHSIIPTADVIAQDASTKAFAKKYYQAYHTLPGKNAYKGYDFGRYLVAFVKANRNGAFTLPDATNLFNNYHFKDTYNQVTDDLNNQPVLYQNDFVRMLRMENYQLR